MRTIFWLLSGAAVMAIAQTATQGVPENATQRVSEHVYAIVGFPNIAIVVGKTATLVVDTGMGAKNGAVIVREVGKLTKNPALYLTTTHFHPEHATGEQAFPATTKLIRNRVQQEEMDLHGKEFIDLFSSRSAQNKELLEGVKLRKPDILYDTEYQLDLGEVTARLFWLGPAHTKGDELIFVEGDSVLIPGDIVQSKLIPNMPNSDASVKGWLAILDKLEPLKPRFIVPDHGQLGDGSLIEKEKDFLTELEARALDLKGKGVAVEEAATQVTADMKSKFPDWTGNGLPNAVHRVYEQEK
jgi:glyoxylase-like metal-dependent hydrolase (beta-lactamase superfamily II)